ncbi:OpgC domain-containing protein [Elioraea rosea]|uniref:OpgC domain-containing protein n=1 Tax=Elioraea rosea TaxID=2492390 RepID=UPI0013159F76|nr:OpgC domain-containing protein [Elioraea rosea]
MTAPEAAPSPQPRARRRYPEIDAIRGIAMVTIALNHYGLLVNAMGGYAYRGFTPTLFGFSSAAELFVLVAGLSLGLAGTAIRERSGTGGLVRWAWRRAAILWAANLALLLSIVALAAVLEEGWRERLLAQIGIGNEPVRMLRDIVATALLQRSPQFLDILQMYTVFLAIAPLLILAAVAAPRGALLASLGVWSLVQSPVYAEAIGPSLPAVISGVNFDLLAWQALIVLGIILAAPAMLERFSVPKVVTAALALALIASAVWVVLAAKGHIPPAPMIGKPNLGPLRLLHALAYMAFLWGLVSATRESLAWLWRPFSAIGRQALPVFCISTWLAVALATMIVTLDREGSFYVAYAALPVLTWLAARAWSRAFAQR